MNPIIQNELIKARIADLHRQAERDRMARAARRAGPAEMSHVRLTVPGQVATVLRRWALTVPGVRSA